MNWNHREASKQQEFNPSKEGTCNFKVILLSTDSPLPAALRICLRDMCKEKYGSCSLF